VKPEIIRNYEELEEFMEPFLCDIYQDCQDPELDVNNNDLWLGFRLFGELAGVVCFDKLRGASTEIHPYIGKEFRDFYSRSIVKSAIGYVFDNFSQINKVNATIAERFPRTRAFAKRIGFVDEGVNRVSYLKDNKLYNQWYMGLTRAEHYGQD
jgi:RimJ/RimL family protein N-acetyltransferase